MVNFQANSYVELITWENIEVSDPPAFCGIATEEIIKCIADGVAVSWALPFPCHNQSVERCIKLVTEASNSVCGEMEREGFIRSRLESRKILPVFNTKSDYFKN